MSFKNSNRKSNCFTKNRRANKSIFDSLENFTDDIPKNTLSENKKINREKRAAERRQNFERQKLEEEILLQEKIQQEKLAEEARLAAESLPKLPLETPWDFGRVVKGGFKNWELKLYSTVNDVYSFWRLANITFADKNFRMNSERYNEFWLFRSGCVPDWKKAKEWADIDTIYHVKLLNLSEENVLNTVLYCIGETIACSDNVLGICFKPSMRNPPSIKIWSTTEESAEEIEIFLKKNLLSQGTERFITEIEKK